MSLPASNARDPDLLATLVARGLLIETGAPGVYGHGAEFERVRAGLEALIRREAAAHGAVELRFGPVLPHRWLETSGYIRSFPHLLGSVFALEAAEHAETPGDGVQRTDVSLAPAACYPVYPALAAAGRLPPDGILVETGGAWVFRQEASPGPARRRSFRMQELVRIGRPDAVAEWYESWSRRAAELLRELGLEAELAAANDPFFGRRGRLMAAHQRAQSLKLEVVVPWEDQAPLAVASANLHRDHFAALFGLELEGGEVAHTACLGFGHERIVLALLCRHGFEPASWSRELRDRLR